METRYFLSGKHSWSDVTIQITKSPENPKVGDKVRMGNLMMVVTKIGEGWIHNKQVHKVYITPASIGESLDDMDNITIISIDQDINEAARVSLGLDKRAQASIAQATGGMGVIYSPQTIELGNVFRSALSNMGPGYGVIVTDFMDAITATVTYSNAKTGRCASQSFIVIWQPDRNKKYPYKVMSSIGRWRNCADYGQAINFIRSKSSALSNSTTGII